MTTPSLDERFAPPQSHVADVVPEGSNRLASRWSRLGAGIVDGLIIMAVLWLASKATPWNPWEHRPGDSLWSFKLGNALGGFGVFLLINGYLLSTRAQTIGKLALGLRIVRVDGAPVSIGRLLGLRYGLGNLLGVVPMLSMIYGLVDVVFIFHSSRRCLHDRIAGTIVINA